MNESEFSSEKNIFKPAFEPSIDSVMDQSETPVSQLENDPVSQRDFAHKAALDQHGFGTDEEYKTRLSPSEERAVQIAELQKQADFHRNSYGPGTDAEASIRNQIRALENPES
jgi:hypothetical protein